MKKRIKKPTFIEKIISFFLYYTDYLARFPIAIGKKVRKIVSKILLNLREFSVQYPETSQQLQLGAIYLFGITDLAYASLNLAFSGGFLPNWAKFTFPVLSFLVKNPILRAWSSPEKIFFLSYLVIEFFIRRPTFKFSNLVKYHLILVFSVLILQGLAFSTSELLFNRQVIPGIEKWTYDKGLILRSSKMLRNLFNVLILIIFSCVYLYFYLHAFNRTTPKHPSLKWLTNSVLFWLRMKVPPGKGEKKRK